MRVASLIPRFAHKKTMSDKVWALTEIPLPPGMVAILDLRHRQVPGEPYRESDKEVIDATGALDQLAKECNQDWLLIYAHLLRNAKAHCTATLDGWNKNGVQYYDVRVHYFDLGDADDPSTQ
jgi:hypothetical protein